ncbi:MULTISPECIES: stalk domain-containing protein [Paenibacillus]|uniref:Copper amine oxidase-like N-terminal domain-containing protein n=1 Tax=Paenibacillus albilobatus TaxID=2716884 RepID=A0A919XCL7_9BACL|nr:MULTISPECIES: stalk domain-containing protein [Paenibacillus]GIO30216.1 hypothetical protein J2TS6_13570 [Paenibacillus albilobatus]
MLKKWTACLLASALLAMPMTSVTSFAAKNVIKDVTVFNGQIHNGRVLVPLRVVSENLGAEVEWFQQAKELKVVNGNTIIRLGANFDIAIVETPPPADDPAAPPRKYIELGTAMQIIKGTTYVPLAFVGQSLGANVTWNNDSKQATVTLNGKQLFIHMEQPAVNIPEQQKIPEARLKALSDKLNEAATLTASRNAKTHFKPYFTEKLIQSMIQKKGLGTANTYATPITLPEYISPTKAVLSQSVVLANGLTGEDQYIEDRTIALVYTKGVWKVDNVSTNGRVVTAGFAKDPI